MTAKIRIGTAGWSIASVNADLFPPAGSHLHRYAGRFETVEINSSFYRPHRRTTYQRWAQSTPANFRFCVKLPRTITHERRLVDCQDPIVRFAGEVGGLAEKLGVVLIQLPPSLAFDARVASDFFCRFRSALVAPLACEPRHSSWFDPAAEALLAEHHIARVAADPLLAAGGDLPGGWNGLGYWRWHGSPKVYYSAYDAKRLETLSRRIEALPDRPHWVIFDNTAAFAAARDAAALQASLKTPKAS